MDSHVLVKRGLEYLRTPNGFNIARNMFLFLGLVGLRQKFYQGCRALHVLYSSRLVLGRQPQKRHLFFGLFRFLFAAATRHPRVRTARTSPPLVKYWRNPAQFRAPFSRNVFCTWTLISGQSVPYISSCGQSGINNASFGQSEMNNTRVCTNFFFFFFGRLKSCTTDGETDKVPIGPTPAPTPPAPVAYS